MLKKLARLLRYAGLDCVFLGDASQTEVWFVRAVFVPDIEKVIDVAKAESRTILTSSKRLCQMKLGVPVVQVRSPLPQVT